LVTLFVCRSVIAPRCARADRTRAQDGNHQFAPMIVAWATLKARCLISRPRPCSM
jgi:hypothetical protein